MEISRAKGSVAVAAASFFGSYYLSGVLTAICPPVGIVSAIGMVITTSGASEIVAEKFVDCVVDVVETVSEMRSGWKEHRIKEVE